MTPHQTKSTSDYTATDIEILEGLEPVRRRPAMYIGGTDEKALHHLFAEVIDNAMDEAVAGHASIISVCYDADGFISVTDNGRGIPVDPHPNFPEKSALEIILTTLHAGGKFNSKVYETSGGLHGVGISVVNALSQELQVEVARDQRLYRQSYRQGTVCGPLQDAGPVRNRRGTCIRFRPDPAIFGDTARFHAKTLFDMARAKAYLFGGVEVRWRCDPVHISARDATPARETFHFPGGVEDYLQTITAKREAICGSLFCGKVGRPGAHGSLEWAIGWFANGEGFLQSYCNTIPTRQGGSHEQGLRAGLMRALRTYGELTGVKRVNLMTADDIMASAGGVLSVFIREPEFQGQTKEKLTSASALRLVDQAIKDRFDHWLTGHPAQADKLLNWVMEQTEDRLRRRREREVARKSLTRKLRLPGKLADCSANGREESEIFIVEGDSAGGSAKQARNRATQAVLPLRGKILNVANAASDKIAQNQQLGDLVQALGCGIGKHYQTEGLRYERVIIMTDADVDGAHIAALLMTFFYRQMPRLIEEGHLFLAVPPLYRLTRKNTVAYARDDRHQEELLRSRFAGPGKVDISRFKGLGEMTPAQLKETTMDPAKRLLLHVRINDDLLARTGDAVEQLMGNCAQARFRFITERAKFVDTELLDV